jgi:methyl-accepting chemotaxis protein
MFGDLGGHLDRLEEIVTRMESVAQTMADAAYQAQEAGDAMRRAAETQYEAARIMDRK